MLKMFKMLKSNWNKTLCVCVCVCVCLKRMEEPLCVCVCVSLNFITFWGQRKSMRATEDLTPNFPLTPMLKKSGSGKS